MHDPETIEVRNEERLDLERLEPYLRGRLEGTAGPLQVRQFGGGHATLTYLIALGERESVLRRPPLGPRPAHAHDMRREHAVLAKLNSAFPRAPRSYLLCTDRTILDSDFVIEERRRGIVIRRDLPAAYANDPGFCARLGEAIVDTCGDLHRVDVDAGGLSDLGRPDGYLQRQLDGWRRRWDAARTSATADASQAFDTLQRTLPNSPPAALVHNDYKLDNMLLDANYPSQIAALLDWDMCTLGDPLMDLGYALALWVEPHEPKELRVGAMPTWHPGFPSRQEVVARDSPRPAKDLAQVDWF